MLLCCGHQRSGLSGVMAPVAAIHALYITRQPSCERCLQARKFEEVSGMGALPQRDREIRDFTRSRPWPTSAAIKRAKSEISDFAVGDRSLIRLYGEPSAQDETEMTHTLLGADRAAHLKILAIAIAGVIVVALSEGTPE